MGKMKYYLGPSLSVKKVMGLLLAGDMLISFDKKLFLRFDQDRFVAHEAGATRCSHVYEGSLYGWHT
jgi:hypothetical protein